MSFVSATILASTICQCACRCYNYYPPLVLPEVNVSLEMHDYTVEEDFTDLEVCANITGGELERSVMIEFFTADGTAIGMSGN